MALKNDSYDRLRQYSIYWFTQAEHLNGAAGAVWFALKQNPAEIHTFLGTEVSPSMESFWMLCALALEGLYKAILTEQKKGVPKTHELLQLMRSTGTTPRPTDELFLKVLTEHSIWAGKYPVPLSKDINKLSGLYDHVMELTSDLKQLGRGSLRVYRPNDKGGWTDFQRFWKAGAKVYWAAVKTNAGKPRF